MTVLYVYANKKTGVARERIMYIPSYLDTSILSKYPFINRTNNYIIDKDSLLSSFFTQLNVLKNDTSDFFDYPTKLSIVHIGDSHIQAGELTSTVRILLQKEFGNGGRGLVVPLKLASSNEPYDYSIRSDNIWQNSKCINKVKDFDIGVSGIALATHNTNVSFSINLHKRDSMPDYRFNTIRLFHHPKAPLLSVCDSLSIDISCPDTTKEYVTDIYLRESSDSIVIQGNIVDSLYNTPIFYGFSLENAQPGILYHSIGVNGACFKQYSNNDMFLEQLDALLPNIFIVSLGTNEASTSYFNANVFRDELDAFVKKLKKLYPHIPILLISPVENYRRSRSSYLSNSNIGKLRDVIKAYAENHSVAYWDMYDVCGGDKASSLWYKGGLMAKDRIHYTVEGYRIQGALFYEAIVNSYSK